MQAAVCERELTFVNQESQIHVAIGDAIFDLVERRGHGLEVRLIESEGEVCAREWARDGDALALYVGAGGGCASDESWSVAVAHGGAMRQEGVAFAEIGVGVNGDGGDFELPAHGPLVQR